MQTFSLHQKFTFSLFCYHEESTSGMSWGCKGVVEGVEYS